MSENNPIIRYCNEELKTLGGSQYLEQKLFHHNVDNIGVGRGTLYSPSFLMDVLTYLFFSVLPNYFLL